MFPPLPASRTRLRARACRGLMRSASVLALSLLAPLSFSNLNVAAQDALQDIVAGQVNPNADLLLESERLTYDFDRDLIVASGSVQVFYDGITVEAQEMVFQRRQGQLTARGNVILIEPNGNIVRTEEITLSDDLANGFARALQLDTPQRTRFIADSATRRDSNVTTFENGIYTVYTKPTNPPDKPPLWRIKAATIIHDQQERTIYYEDAAFEFFGTPIAYVPYLSMPDPTVKRKSGFLMPSVVISEKLGYGVTVPYYWALSPHYDLTTELTPLTKQGVVGDATFRQRISNGKYTLATAGLFQAQTNEFAGTSGDQRWRGAVKTTGEFALSSRWTFGWDATYKSDRVFLKDYSFVSFDDNNETSKVFLEGYTDRNSLIVRGYAFSISQEDYTPSNPSLNAPGFSSVGSSLQDKQPFVAPLIDYDYVFADPIADGELALTANFSSLTRAETDAFSPDGGTTTRYRGIDGTFSRLSLGADWRRTLIDPLGQSFTPFAYMRGDLFWQASADNDVTELTSDAFVGRAMPAVGLEYRYPFIATFDGGNQIVEPIAQIIVRPDEQKIGQLPNDDAQSLVFDTTTLFDYDKFSGFDRAEGGTRLNLGMNYRLQLNEGYHMTAMFGRSYHLAGRNSYEIPDLLGAAQDSGLASSESDYVGSLNLDTRYGVRLGAQARFDDDDFSVNRLQAQASGAYGPVVSTIAYAFLDAQPSLGIETPREEVLGAASLRLEENWRAFGSLRYDLENSDVVQNGVGLGYDDEGFSISVSYGEDRSRNDSVEVDRTVFVRIGLRTLGNTQTSTNVNR